MNKMDSKTAKELVEKYQADYKAKYDKYKALYDKGEWKKIPKEFIVFEYKKLQSVYGYNLDKLLETLTDIKANLNIYTADVYITITYSYYNDDEKNDICIEEKIAKLVPYFEEYGLKKLQKEIVEKEDDVVWVDIKALKMFLNSEISYEAMLKL